MNGSKRVGSKELTPDSWSSEASFYTQADSENLPFTSTNQFDIQGVQNRRKSKKNGTSWTFITKMTLHSLRVRKKYMISIILLMILTVTIAIFLESVVSVFPSFVYKTQLATRDKADLKLMPINGRRVYYNVTKAQERYASDPDTFVSGRMYKMGYLQEKGETPKAVTPIKRDEEDLYNATQADVEKSFKQAVLVFYDHKAEQHMKFEDDFQQPGPGECLISSKVSEQLGYKAGDTIKVVYEEGILEEFLFGQWTENEQEVKQALGMYTLELKVKQVVIDMKQRLKTRYTYFIFVDLKTAFKTLVSARKSAFPADERLSTLLESIDMGHYTSSIKVRLAAPSYLYYNVDMRKTREVFLNKSSKFLLDWNPQGTVTDPIMYERMDDKEALLDMLNSLAAAVLAAVVGLSAFILSTLFSSMILTKRHDIAIMRSCGMSKSDLYWMMLFQSCVIGFVTICLALFPLQGVFMVLNKGTLGETSDEAQIGLTWRGIFIGITFAVLVPFCSTLLPLREVLSQHLVNDLDLVRSTQDVIKLRVTKSDPNAVLSPGMTNVCLSGVFVGLAVYLGFPWAILTGQMLLITLVLVSLLAATGVGFVIIMMAFHQFTQDFVLKVILLAKKAFNRVVCKQASSDGYLPSLLRAHLAAHRDFVVKSTFVLVIGLVVINVIHGLLVQLTQSEIETDLRSQGSKFTMVGTYKASAIKGWYEDFLRKFKLETGFVTVPISLGANPVVQSHSVLTMNGISTVGATVIGLTPSYTKLAEYRFAEIYDSHLNTSLSPVEYLYTRFGQEYAVMSTATSTDLGLDCTNLQYPDWFRIRFTPRRLPDSQETSSSSTYTFKCLAAADNMPGIPIQSNSVNKGASGVVLSLPTITSLGDEGLNPTFDFTEDLMIGRYWIETNEEMQGRTLKDTVISFDLAVPGLKRGYYHQSVVSTIESPTDMATFSWTINLTLHVVFFLLYLIKFVSSLSTQVSQETKTLGTLRSLGLSRGNTATLFMLELLVIIGTGVLVSFVIVSLLLAVLVAQFNSFLDAYCLLRLPWEGGVAALLLGGVGVGLWVRVVVGSAVSRGVAGLIRGSAG